MNTFVSTASHTEAPIKTSGPRKTFEAPSVQVGAIDKVIFKEDLGSNHNSLIELWFLADKPTEGLILPETGNKQYCKNSFWLTENALKEYTDPEKKKPNYASLIRFLAILADNLEIRPLWDKASAEANSYSDYATIVANFWKGRRFAGLLRGEERSFINGEGEKVTVVDSSLNVFGVFARTTAKIEELNTILEESVKYAAQPGKKHPLMKFEEKDEEASTVTTGGSDW